MSRAYIKIVNNSNRILDKVIVRHAPTEPQEGIPYDAYELAISVTDLANGQTSPTAEVGTASGDIYDYWIGGVLFEGDGEAYIMSGDTWSPYKEYAVSNDNTLTLTIPPYEENSSNQGLVKFDDHTRDPATARLLNHTTSELVNWAKLVGEIVAELVE